MIRIAFTLNRVWNSLQSVTRFSLNAPRVYRPPHNSSFWDCFIVPHLYEYLYETVGRVNFAGKPARIIRPHEDLLRGKWWKGGFLGQLFKGDDSQAVHAKFMGTGTGEKFANASYLNTGADGVDNWKLQITREASVARGKKVSLLSCKSTVPSNPSLTVDRCRDPTYFRSRQPRSSLDSGSVNRGG